jgi:hypothetical protein
LGVFMSRNIFTSFPWLLKDQEKDHSDSEDISISRNQFEWSPKRKDQLQRLRI